MTSNNWKKPTQEFYRPPKSESSNERIFYNSNHKKSSYSESQSRNTKSGKEGSYTVNSQDNRRLRQNPDKYLINKDTYNEYQSSQSNKPYRSNNRNYKYESYCGNFLRNNQDYNRKGNQDYNRKGFISREISERIRHDSFNKEYNSDSRLFNPYKPEDKKTQQLSTKTTKNVNKSENYMYSGSKHLPLNIDVITNENASSNDYKPTLVVRPTLNQLPSDPTIMPTYAVTHPSNYGAQNFVQTSNFSPYINASVMPGEYNYRSAVIPTNNIENYQTPVTISQNTTINQNIEQIKTLEVDLDVFLKNCYDITAPNWWDTVNKIRNNLMELYKKVILNDLDYCNKSNIEQNLWKSTFYSVMELVRSYLQNPHNLTPVFYVENNFETHKAFVTEKANALLTSGTDYFSDLYKEISRKYRVDLESIFKSRHPPPETGSRTRKLVYLSTQKLLLFLGDLARYLEILKPDSATTADYSPARIWYLKANLLVPQNGRPYNQLAVISLYVNRYLDALYYYTRTLAATNPFSTASQNLCFLFEQTRKKNEELVRREHEQLQVGKQKRSPVSNVQQKGCIEVWIHPDDGTKEKKVFDDDNNDELDKFLSPDEIRQRTELKTKEYYASLSTVELHRKFIFSYLNLQGMLYNKINMEQFPDVCSTTLCQLQSLLSRQSLPLTEQRLCNLLMINMFIMDYVCSRQPLNQLNPPPCDDAVAIRTVHQDHASRMTMDFFAILCQRTKEMTEEWIENLAKIDDHDVPDDLGSFLTSICLWTDWMVTRPEFWNPSASQRDPILPPNIDDFKILAEFCTLVNSYLEKQERKMRPTYRIITCSKEAEQLISKPGSFMLLEESLISGFLPMLDQTAKIYLLEDDSWTVKQLINWIHLEKIGMFAEFLTGITPPILSYDVNTRVYTSNIIKETSEKPEDVNKTVESDDDDSKVEQKKGATKKALFGEFQETIDVIMREHLTLSEETQSKLSTDASSSQADIAKNETNKLKLQDHNQIILDLKLKIANQKYKQKLSDKYESWRQSLLEGEYSQKYLKIIIQPLYLIFDTNCYVDNWKMINNLGKTGKFIIVVPIVVVNELEKLSRGSHHDLKCTRTNARAALNFLEAEFSNSSPDSKYRALTAQGNPLTHIRFRTEQLKGHEGDTNDDIILHCCSSFIKDKPSEFMPRKKGSKPITLNREIVLITGDCILRLKAKDRNIPVRPMNEFFNWLNSKQKPTGGNNFIYGGNLSSTKYKQNNNYRNNAVINNKYNNNAFAGKRFNTRKR